MKAGDGKKPLPENGEPLAGELSRKSTSAVLWGGSEVLLRQCAGFIISIVLARLLAPQDFGVIGMLALFTGIASVFVDSGFSSALIQRKDPTPVDISSVFYFNVMAALIMALLLAAAAPYIASFYQMPILRPLTWMMALNLFLSSFRSIQTVLMTKRLDFHTQMKVTVGATVISGTIGILLAWHGWGVWSLAIQLLVSTIVSVVLLWRWSAWRPMLSFSMTSLRSLYRYGSFMFLSGLTDTFYTRLNTLLIGKLYSARDLGLYTRADHMQQLPTSAISTLLGRVSFPVFVAASENRESLCRAVRKALLAIVLVNTPLMLGILAAAHELVLVLFGEKWLPCVPYLRILSLAGVFWPLHVINLNVLKSQGRSDLFFRLEMIKKALGFTLLLVAAQISVMAMAWSQVLLGVVCYFVNSFYSGTLAGYSTTKQLRDMLPYFGVALVTLGATWSMTLWTVLPTPAVLLLQIVVGLCVYIGLCFVFRLPAFRDALLRIKSHLPANRVSADCASALKP